MHANELVELAAFLTANGSVLIESGMVAGDENMQRYWSASKCRLQRWSLSMKRFGARSERHSRFHFVRPVVEEIFASDVLTRVWSAVVTGHDNRVDSQQHEPIADSIRMSHMEARNRALKLIVDGRNIQPSQAAALNKIRRRAERWTDILIGNLWDVGPVEESAYDQQRASDYADDFREERKGPPQSQAFSLMLAQIKGAFPKGLGRATPNADLNSQIASSILGCFPTPFFDSAPLAQSLWKIRIFCAASSAEEMIADLIVEETGSPIR